MLWKSNKQSVVSRCSAQLEYHVMANITCELVWIRDLMVEFGFAPVCLVRLYCDNEAAIHIDENLIFYERIKHIEVDYYLVCPKIKEKIVQARYVSFDH